jgi:hypothetical protein
VQSALDQIQCNLVIAVELQLEQADDKSSISRHLAWSRMLSLSSLYKVRFVEGSGGRGSRHCIPFISPSHRCDNEPPTMFQLHCTMLRHIARDKTKSCYHHHTKRSIPRGAVIVAASDKECLSNQRRFAE